jgi:hypothetical protein
VLWHDIFRRVPEFGDYRKVVANVRAHFVEGLRQEHVQLK